MNPEVKQSEFTDTSSPEFVAEAGNQQVEVSVDEPGTLTMLPPASTSSDQWREIGEKVSAFLASLPDYVTQFFNQYQRPLITLGLLLGGFISVKLTFAILDSINDIPLLAPTFELIGIAYSAWFIYRYLLRAENRQELAEDIESLKDQVVGGRK